MEIVVAGVVGSVMVISWFATMLSRIAGLLASIDQRLVTLTGTDPTGPGATPRAGSS